MAYQRVALLTIITAAASSDGILIRPERTPFSARSPIMRLANLWKKEEVRVMVPVLLLLWCCIIGIAIYGGGWCNNTPSDEGEKISTIDLLMPTMAATITEMTVEYTS